MARYILTKLQIKRLIDDKPVIDGRGTKLFASGNVKDVLKKIDKLNLYNKFDVVLENGQIDIAEKKLNF